MALQFSFSFLKKASSDTKTYTIQNQNIHFVLKHNNKISLAGIFAHFKGLVISLLYNRNYSLMDKKVKCCRLCRRFYIS